MRIDIVVYDGLDELDAVGPLEVLRGAAAAGADLDVRLAGRTDLTPVVGTFGLTFTPEVVFTPGEADVVVVPGGGWAARGERGAWGEVSRGDWLGPLADAAEQGALVASVCTGAMLLAHAGVIGTRTATTHHVALDDLTATGATVVTARVVDSGRVITGGGVTSGIDVALHLVERLVGPEAAEAAAQRMEYARHPVVVVDED
jgi:transcriptional regulator GlxA family with amidase domain